MKQVRFVVLDLVVGEDGQEQMPHLDTVTAFRDSATDCLRELGHYIAASQDGSASSTFFLSLIVATAREDPTQVRFTYRPRSSYEQTTYRSPPGIAQAAEVQAGGLSGGSQGSGEDEAESASS